MIRRLLVRCVAIMCLGAMNSQATVGAQATDQRSATFYILNDVTGVVIHFDMTVTDNGEPLATVAENRYAVRRVVPGRHVLKGATLDELVINAAAGETYYFKRGIQWNILLRPTATFGRIPKDEAKRRLAELKPTDEQSAALTSSPAAWIFVANMGNDQIVRIDDMTGFAWTTFGSRGSGANQFLGPAGIFVDTGGKIFVADPGNHRIVRIDDMTGAGWTTLGSRGDETNQFDSPRGIFVDARGRIFVTDSNNHRIVRIDNMTGAGWTTFGSFGEGANQLLGPVGVFTDATGKIFVTDAGNYRITRIEDMTGAGWTSFGSRGNGIGQFNDPSGIFVGPAGQISVTDTANNQIVRMDNLTESGWITFGGVGSDGKGQLIHPAGIFVR